MNDQEIDLVRGARPVDPPHDPAAKARAWARLHAEFDAPHAGVAWAHAPDGGRWPSAWRRRVPRWRSPRR